MRTQNNSVIQPYASEPAVFALLDVCVGRLQRRKGEPFAVNKERLRHIADWLRAAIANDDPWLKNVDTQGRPKKLMKFSTFDAIVREADKAMMKAAQRLKGVKLVKGDEELVEVLDNGYYVVRLLTPAALDRESAEMQHCIGNGGYDECLSDGLYAYLSLRGARGKAHATMEIEGRKIIQLQGKQNASPLRKYLDVLAPYIRASGLVVGVPAYHLGHVMDAGGTWYPIDNLPDGLKVDGGLDLSRTPVEKLPEGLTVGGNLDLVGTLITELPSGLAVGGSLYLAHTRIAAVPEGLTIAGDLILRDTKIAELPRGLTVAGDLDLTWTGISALPDGLSVGGNLSLTGTKIAALPKGFSVVGNLEIASTPITILPEGMTVGGSLYINDTPITALPKGLTVGRSLHISRTPIKTLPDGMRVGGGLYMRHMKIAEIVTFPRSIDDDTPIHCVDGILTARECRGLLGKRTSIPDKKNNRQYAR